MRRTTKKSQKNILVRLVFGLWAASYGEKNKKEQCLHGAFTSFKVLKESKTDVYTFKCLPVLVGTIPTHLLVFAAA